MKLFQIFLFIYLSIYSMFIMDIYSNSKILSFIGQQKGSKLTELKYLFTDTRRESRNNG